MKISEKKFNRESISITSMAFLVEFGLFIFSLLWIMVRRIPVFKDIKITWEAFATGVIAGILIMAAGVIFYVLDKGLFRGKVRQTMESQIYPMFHDITPVGILLVAFMSGFCEELFFRGVLLTEIGIFFSSVIFGLLHTPGKKVWMLGAWTAFIGMVMALLYRGTGNLFVPMTAHMINNLVAISYIRYLHPDVKRRSGLTPGEDKQSNETETELEGHGVESGETETTADSEISRSIAGIKKDAAEVIRFHVKEKVSKARKSLKEAIGDMADLAKEFEEEFIPSGKKHSLKSDSPVQLLNEQETDSEEEEK
jgi:uncharacterized protein